jgi:2,4-dienoyl-CoA reductase-like NADH-dependent reductase (Old Yellow Enzyme family)
MSHNLFTPVTLPTPDGTGLEVGNRAFVAPMCQYAVDNLDGSPTDWHLSHLGALAAGGFGLVVAEATAVEARGRISPLDLGLWDAAQVVPHARIVDFIHGQGRAAGVQLGHAGGKASTQPMLPGSDDGTTIPADQGGWPTVSADDAPVMPTMVAASALTEAQIAEVVDAFAAAARRADEAGYDVVQLHAAHGYLIHQFLSPLTNHRTDSYGGDLAGRSRLLREVVAAVREVWPDDKPLGIRVSATDWVDDGVQVSDVAEVLRDLVAAGQVQLDRRLLRRADGRLHHPGRPRLPGAAGAADHPHPRRRRAGGGGRRGLHRRCDRGRHPGRDDPGDRPGARGLRRPCRTGQPALGGGRRLAAEGAAQGTPARRRSSSAPGSEPGAQW